MTIENENCPNCGRLVHVASGSGAIATGRIPVPDEHREHGECSCGATLTRSVGSPWLFDRPRQLIDYPELNDFADEELSEAYMYLQPGEVLTAMQGVVRLSRCLNDADNPRVTEAAVVERVCAVRADPEILNVPELKRLD